MGRKIKKETTFGDEVLHGLTDFFEATEKGDPVTMRTVKLDLTPARYDPQDVKRTRTRLAVSQAVFAQLMAVSVKLVQHWEQGVRKPEPIACRLLDDMNDDPQRWLAKLKPSPVTAPRQRRRAACG